MYTVIVGNIGKVTETDGVLEAVADYNEYVGQSRSNYGRAAGEPVTLMHTDDGVLAEYVPEETIDMDTANFTITRGTRSWGVTVHPGTMYPYRALVKTTDGPLEHKFTSFEAMMELLVDSENSRLYEQIRKG